jgi:ubiquinone/menaquinone biosynthesis C-methylase UbiE
LVAAVLASEDTPEAAWILNVLGETLGRKPKHILELGAGGGNMASHILPHVSMTLTDVSGRMLEISRRLNPTPSTSKRICAACASARPSARC